MSGDKLDSKDTGSFSTEKENLTDLMVKGIAYHAESKIIVSLPLTLVMVP